MEIALYTTINFVIHFVCLSGIFILKLYPPKDINSIYGYRTKQSMQNTKKWELANRVAPNIFIRNIIVGFFVCFVFYFVVKLMPRLSEVVFFIPIFTISASFVISFFQVEKVLNTLNNID